MTNVVHAAPGDTLADGYPHFMAPLLAGLTAMVMSAQPPFQGRTGTGYIAGNALRAGGGTASLAILHRTSGYMVATAIPAAGTGAYRFDDLAPGEYVVSLFDGTGVYKSETLHTVLS